MLALVLGKELFGLSVVLAKLFDHVSTNITVILLDLLGDAERVFGRNARLASVSEELLNERRNVSSRNRDVSDRGANNVSLGLNERGEDTSVTREKNFARKCANSQQG